MATRPVLSSAQVPTQGQPVFPVFEGWEQRPDGSFSMVFGYHNRNWEERITVPIGPGNSIEPGGPDRGQPTHFYPRRSRFVFRVAVPKDFGNKEVVWTLTINGKTQRAFGTLKPDYVLDNNVIQANNGDTQISAPDNIPPVVKFEGEPPRTVKVGEQVALNVTVTDDGKPARKPMREPTSRQNGIIPSSATGLRFAWFVYRGDGTKVKFDPEQFVHTEDDRDGHNSPWSRGWVPPPVPADGKWAVRATFSEPGTYVLRALGHDGGLDTPVDITFTVTK